MEKINFLSKHKIKSKLISIAGKVLHIIFSGGNTSIEKTSKGYIERTKLIVDIDENFKSNIVFLQKEGKGIIILNHKSGVFSDYLPLFAYLGDNILEKCIFYTGSYNVKMNIDEFPGYRFRQATLTKREDVIGITKKLTQDIEEINTKGGYIFIIPAGANIDDNSEFLAIFQKICKLSSDNLHILVNKVTHDNLMGYREIVASIIGYRGLGVTTIKSVINTVGEWKKGGKVMSGEEMREYYNKIFKK